MVELIVGKPSGVVENDLMVAVVAVDYRARDIVQPAGWTLILNTDSFDVSYKVAGAGEGANYTFTWLSPQQAYGFILRITGHDTSTPINVSGSGNGSSTSATCPTVTTTIDDCLILRIFKVQLLLIQVLQI